MDNLELLPLPHDARRPGSLISGNSNDSTWTLESERALVDTSYDSGNHAAIVKVQPQLGQRGSYNWLPATLRLPYLISLFSFSTILGVVVLVLTAYSARNHGLGNDNGSAGLLFSWRFSPTLFAVIYSILTATLLNDVRRTEIFVRLSRQGAPSSSSATLCFPSRFWWNDPVDALSKAKNNGSRSWALFLTSIVNTLGFLIISPLSAGLLGPLDIDVPKRTSFNQLDTVSDIPLQLNFTDQMMFNTISGAILNRTTSAWIYKDYFVLPFWPADLDSAQLAATFQVAQVPQLWTGETTAYKATLDCVDVSLKSQRNLTASDLGLATRGNRTEDYNGTAIQLSSNDGCIINLFTQVPYSSDATWLNIGGGWWADSVSDINLALLNTPSTSPGKAIVNTTGNCNGRSFISYNMPWRSSQPFDIKGHLCTTQFLEANVSATVAMNGTALVTFDPSEFTKNKTMDSAKYKIPQLQNSFFNASWSTKFPAANQYTIHNVTVPFGGPLQAIAASVEYDNSPQKLVDSQTIVDECRQLQQQWFGQMLLSSLSIERRPAAATVQGQVKVTERRIVTVMGIGVTIGVLFLMSSASLIAIAYVTRLKQRPLNLQSDPASIAVASSLIVDDTITRATFEGTDRWSKDAIRQRLLRETYSLHGGNLVAGTHQLVLRSTFESGTYHATAWMGLANFCR
jgi:hypothetical protein